jgi:hypothetical protein
MAVTALDTPTSILIRENGAPGLSGTDGTDGIGFNGVRKSLIDNPLCWLYKKNNLVNIIKNVLTIIRPSTGNFTDIYGVAQVAAIDAPREEAKGWLIDNTDTYTFDVADNIPLLDNGFSVVLRVGAYAEAAVSQKIFTVPGLNGDLLSIGSDGSGNWLATIRGSDLLEYNATTVISATSAIAQTVIVNYSGGKIDIYINGSLSGTATIVTSLTDGLDLEASVLTAGNFTLNMQGLRFYDFILNADEITYIN